MLSIRIKFYVRFINVLLLIVIVWRTAGGLVRLLSPHRNQASLTRRYRGGNRFS